jgi:hypothetical protein
MGHSYHCDPPIASPEAYEERIRFLARQLAELVEINFTLKRQRDAAQAELREFKRGPQ